MTTLYAERCRMSEQLNERKEVVEEKGMSEQQRILDVLERARQEVKPIVKKEMEGEVITDELLNLRLKT